MQSIILAGGDSSRFWPLNEKHKSLFKLMGKPLIVFLLENLKKAGIKEVIIVQKATRDIEKELEKQKILSSLKIKYIVQEKPLGTGHALKEAEKYLKEKFLVLYGDDFYSDRDIKESLKKFPSLLVKEVENPSRFGVVLNRKDVVLDIVEKSENPPSRLVNAGGFFIPKETLSGKISLSSRGEYEITDYIRMLAQKRKLFFSKAKDWFPLSFSWDLLEIKNLLLDKLKPANKGSVEKNCHIKNIVFIDKGTVIKSGAYIKGPVYIGKNCEIGPNCYIRPGAIIEDNCFIGQGTEVKNSIISSNCKLFHFNYVGDSILGENCNLGAGVILANLRFDEKNIYSFVKGRSIDTGRKKFGAVLGKGVKVGVNSSLMPGVLINEGAIIYPNSLIRKNITDS